MQRLVNWVRHHGLSLICAIAILIVLLIAMALPAPAQVLQCFATDAAHARLEQIGERRLAVALDPRGAPIEFWASESGAWTALQHRPGGMACVVSHGVAFTLLPAPPEGAPT